MNSAARLPSELALFRYLPQLTIPHCGGSKDVRPPGDRIYFNFMQFSGNLSKIVSRRSLRVGAPSPGKSWIRHGLTLSELVLPSLYCAEITPSWYLQRGPGIHERKQGKNIGQNIKHILLIKPVLQSLIRSRLNRTNNQLVLSTSILITFYLKMH